MWWAVQTLTSLGYGDFTPSTFLGKIVGSMCAVSGVLVMALPIPIVVDNFGDYYAEQKKLEQQELKKEAQERAAKMVRRQEETMRDGAVDTLFCQKGIIKTPSVWSLEVCINFIKYCNATQGKCYYHCFIFFRKNQRLNK